MTINNIAEIKLKTGRIINEYNKLAKFTIEYSEPSLYELLQLLFQNLDEYYDVKENQLVGAIFMLLYEFHEIDDPSFLEQGLKKVRVWSKFNDIFYLMRALEQNFYNDLIGLDDESKFESEEPHQMMDDQVIYDLIVMFLKENGISKLEDLPKKNVFDKIRKLQTTLEFNKDLYDTVEKLVWYLGEYSLDNKHQLLYNLFLVSPFAHTAMVEFFQLEDVNERIELLITMKNAFEIIHKEDLKKEIDNFYKYENYSEYILTLESLGFLYKREGEFTEAIEIYKLALSYDKQDTLKIKQAMMLPLIGRGKFDEFISIIDCLDEDDVYRTYSLLFSELSSNENTYKYYQDAIRTSEIIMDMLCNDVDRYNEASEEEKRYLEDFFDVWQHQPNLLKKLITLHNTCVS